MLKPWPAILVAVGIAIIVMLALCSKGNAECLRSAQAVWNAHDGAHATWSMRHDKKCWYARTERKVMPIEDGPKSAKPSIYNSHENRAGAAGEIIPLPRPAMRTGSVLPGHDALPVSPVGPSSTPRGLVRAEHDQFITWSTDSALDTDVSALLFLQDRMIAAGWRLWLRASVEKFQDAQARLLPLR